MRAPLATLVATVRKSVRASASPAGRNGAESPTNDRLHLVLGYAGLHHVLDKTALSPVEVDELLPHRTQREKLDVNRSSN